MRPILEVENLAKAYAMGVAESHGTVREAITQAICRPFSKGHASEPNRLWALRDVSFSADPGDVIGVIGRNGAGKSTLLKILSRITEPTNGRVTLYGRVGSLLEVGTGFHQDLTGRENVYLNGAILGMKRAEIERKFDEVVAFAEVERFIDMPVKQYSTGMYQRLAFAVAAFLESEILLVDEVLAVGDVSFQKRCLGKMRDVSASGRTVLFVSHNMASIESLCDRCLYISEGRLQGIGVPHDLIRRYLSAETIPQTATKKLDLHQGRPGRFEPMMRSVRLSDEADTPTATIRMGGGLSVCVEYYSERLAVSPSLGLVIKSNYGQPIFGISNRLVRGYQFQAPSHAGTIACHFQNLPLMPDTYSIDLFFGDLYQDYDVVYDAITFDVTAADVFGNGKLPSADCGSIFWPASWTHIPSVRPLAAASDAR